MSPRILLAVCVASTVAGCSTYGPALDLADKTSANVGIVSARLRQLAAESDRLYQERVDNISQLASVNAQARAQLAYDRALAAKVGSPDERSAADDLRAWKQQVDQIFTDAQAEATARRTELQGKETPIDVKSQALQQVAQTLAALARKESLAEQAKLLGQFAATTRDDVKDQLDSGTKAAGAAKALLDGVKRKLAVPAPHPAGQ
jgi:hypothetical protein